MQPFVHSSARTPHAFKRDPQPLTNQTNQTHLNRATNITRKPNSEIIFSADDDATVFVNFDNVGTSNHWNEITKTKLSLSQCDVIAFGVTDLASYNGLIASIKFGQQVISTGSDVGWRARREY